jgi:hypothetical protein
VPEGLSQGEEASPTAGCHDLPEEDPVAVQPVPQNGAAPGPVAERFDDHVRRTGTEAPADPGAIRRHRQTGQRRVVGESPYLVRFAGPALDGDRGAHRGTGGALDGRGPVADGQPPARPVVSLRRLDLMRFEAPPVQEPGDALQPGVGQQTGGAGEVAVDRKGRGTPDGDGRHGGKISASALAGLRPAGG